MTPKEFQRFLDRDGAHCYHCGTAEGLVPQHRINRGMGGSKLLNVPSNIITFCSAHNGAIEASGPAAEDARAMGWKLQQWETDYLLVRPVYDRAANAWFFLDDEYHRTAA